MTAKLKTAVLGATGYSGLELARLLGRHPRTEAPLLLRRSADKSAEIEAGRSAAGVPHISGNGQSPVQPFSWSALQQHGVELLFLATPHAVSRELVPEAMARRLRVVDLSGAWRLKQEEHRAVYGFKDANPVSYTHLDVYKRQTYCCGKTCHPTSAVCNPGSVFPVPPTYHCCDKENASPSDSFTGGFQ